MIHQQHTHTSGLTKSLPAYVKHQTWQKVCLLYFQSHISENLEEVALVKELFPESKSYTDVYHKHNLLTDKVRTRHCL